MVVDYDERRTLGQRGRHPEDSRVTIYRGDGPHVDQECRCKFWVCHVDRIPGRQKRWSQETAAMVDPGAKIYPVVSQPICRNANNSENPGGTGKLPLVGISQRAVRANG